MFICKIFICYLNLIVFFEQLEMSAMHNNLHETHNDRNVVLQDGPKNKRKLKKKKDGSALFISAMLWIYFLINYFYHANIYAISLKKTALSRALVFQPMFIFLRRVLLQLCNAQEVERSHSSKSSTHSDVHHCQQHFLSLKKKNFVTKKIKHE